ncbi:MAG: nucleotide exchange factor GrpE [Candidatus Pelagibacter bacterium]|nr:nucleotide exchange factor GrpE [Candidatus Pelagibacter bacterium]MBL6861035.1 nucleotide exchange factor GrpE [Candidatus Pelagibacter bacterium]
MSENTKEENIEKQENTEPTSEESVQDLKNDEKKEIPKDQTPEEKLQISEDKLLRSLAEIENQRRRFEKEVKDAFEFGSFNFAKESLAILDNLQRAKEAIKNDEKLKKNQDLDSFLENITIIEKDLISIFEKNRIKKIEVENKKFDPNIHQAMSEIEDEKVEPGNVLQEIQAGYMLGERLLRPALVSVSKKKITKDQENAVKKEEK